MKNLYRFLFLIYSPILIALVILSVIVMALGNLITKICLGLSKFIDFNTEIVAKLFIKKS